MCCCHPVCVAVTPCVLCVVLCSRSAGEDATPENKAVQQSLAAMLTPYLYQQISKMSTREVCCIILFNAPLTTWCAVGPETVKQQHRKSLSNLGQSYQSRTYQFSRDTTKHDKNCNTIISHLNSIYVLHFTTRESVTLHLVMTFSLTYSKMS